MCLCERRLTDMEGVVLDDWFWVPRPRIDPTVRLICFPYAGGDAPAYRDLAFAVPARIEVWALRSPGPARGSIVAAPASIGALAADAARVIDDRPHPATALLGESFGAAVALEVARRLSGGHLLLGLVVAGSSPPHRWPPPAQRPDPHSPSALVAYARRVLPSLPPDLDEEYLGPVLRGLAEDLALLRAYDATPEPRLACPILALAGDRDPETARELAHWGRYTSAPPTAPVVVPGDHLVVRTGGAEATRVIVDRLDGWLAAKRGAPAVTP